MHEHVAMVRVGNTWGTSQTLISTSAFAYHGNWGVSLWRYGVIDLLSFDEYSEFLLGHQELSLTTIQADLHFGENPNERFV